MDDTWDVTEDSQQNVDEEVGAAATLEEDTEWWEDDGENDLANIAEGVLALIRVEQNLMCSAELHRSLFIMPGSSPKLPGLRP